MNEAKNCIYCGARAERWCDFILGFTDPDGDGLFAFDTHEFMRCDAPLCVEHAVFQHNVHISGKAGCNESVDYCRGHDPRDDRWGPITEQQAERIRYRHRCAANGPLRLVTTGLGTNSGTMKGNSGAAD